MSSIEELSGVAVVLLLNTTCACNAPDSIKAIDVNMIVNFFMAIIF
jgi:hypothetical protein